MASLRRRRCTPCRCGKTAYTSWRRAHRAATGLPVPGRVYWATCAGAWHITHTEQATYARRRTALAGDR